MMSTATLKRIALICMVLDHTAEYIPGIPLWFRWIGRIAAPLFLFLFVNGMDYTKDRKKFVKRLYIFNAVTSGIMFAFNQTPLHRDMFNTITSNILGTFTAIYFLIRTVEKVRKREGAWKLTLAVYILCQIFSTVVWLVLNFNWSSAYAFTCVIAQLSGNIFFNEGRLFWVLLGIMMYYTKDSKARLSVGYALMVGVESVIWLHQIPAVICTTYVHSEVLSIFVGVLGYASMPRGHVNPFTDYYQWMMIFALPFVCFYNGERGKYHKLFYYIFYPLHRTVFLGIEMVIPYFFS